MYLAKDNAYSILASAINASVTSLSVQSGHGDRFPIVAGTDYTYVTLEDTSGNMEIVKVTARASGSNTFTIERAKYGTTARSFASGSIVSLRPIAAIIQEAINHIEDVLNVHAAESITFTPFGTIASTNVQDALEEIISELGASPSAASVSFAPGGIIESTNVQGAIDELALDISNFYFGNITIGGNKTYSGLSTYTGDILLSGNGRRITGDFANATVTNRPFFQPSVTNNNMVLGIIPNGTGVNASYMAVNNSNVSGDYSYASFGIISTTEVRLEAGRVGAATYPPMTFIVGGAVALKASNAGNWAINSEPQSNVKLAIFQASNTANEVIRLVSAASGVADQSFLVSYSASGGDAEFVLRNNGQAYADQSWNGGGADYAEYFEWLDGNPNDEDRRGLSVVLVGDKIRPAFPSETNIIGVISANPSVVGDAAWNFWKGKYLLDDYGTYITETVERWTWREAILEAEAVEAKDAVPAVLDEEGEIITPEIPAQPYQPAQYTYKDHHYFFDQVPDGVVVPDDKEITLESRRKLNPDYTPTEEYIPREDRVEWGCVGLMGKLRLRVGQPVSPSWIKMRDVSALVEEWLIK